MSESRYSHNLSLFLRSITPSFTKAHISSSKRSTKSDSDFSFLDLWSFFDEPYGHECSLTLENGEKRDTYFVPYLSAIQLFTPTIDTVSSGKPIFQFFENVGPYLRVPVVDKIKILSKYCPLLLNGRNNDLDLERSWFSIYWHPILSDYNLTQPLSGSFLTYHSFELVGRSPFRHSFTIPQRLKNTSQCPSEESSKESDESSSVSSKGSPSRNISSRSSNASNVSSRNSTSSKSSNTPTSTTGEHHRKPQKSKTSDRKCTVCTPTSEIFIDLKNGKTQTSHSLRKLLFGDDKDRNERYCIGILGFICHNVWETTWFCVDNNKRDSKQYDLKTRSISPSVTPPCSTLFPFFYSNGYASYKEIFYERIWNYIEKAKTLHPDFIFMTRQPITT